MAQRQANLNLSSPPISYDPTAETARAGLERLQVDMWAYKTFEACGGVLSGPTTHRDSSHFFPVHRV